VIETAEVPRSSAMLLDIKLRRRRGHRLVPAADAGGMTELALGATSWRSVSSGGPRQRAVTAHAGIAAEWDVVCEKAKSSKDLAAVIGKVAPLVQQRVHRTIHQLWTQPSGVIATSAMSLPASRGPLAAPPAPRRVTPTPDPLLLATGTVTMIFSRTRGNAEDVGTAEAPVTARAASRPFGGTR
jgi:hypothetical protein